MKFLNRRPILKRFYFSLGFSLLTTLLCSLLLRTIILPVPPNVSFLGNGDIIEITGPENIDISIYADEASSKTSILSNGVVILSTEPRVKEGYYDIKGVIHPGTYQISGASAYLKLQENAQVTNKDMEKRTKDINKKMLDFVFILSLVVYFAFAPQMVNLNKTEETESPVK